MLALRQWRPGQGGWRERRLGWVCPCPASGVGLWGELVGPGAMAVEFFWLWQAAGLLCALSPCELPVTCPKPQRMTVAGQPIVAAPGAGSRARGLFWEASVIDLCSGMSPMSCSGECELHKSCKRHELCSLSPSEPIRGLLLPLPLCCCRASSEGLVHLHLGSLPR